MRVRNRNQPNSSHWSVNLTFMGKGSLPSATTRVQPYYDYNSQISDVHPSDPSVYNPVSHTSNLSARWSGEIEFGYSPPTPTARCSYSGGLQYLPPTVPYAPNWGALLDQLSATLAGRTRNASMLLLTLKELGSTIAMFRNPFQLMKPNWRSVAKNHPAATLARKSANVWLEYLYGWSSFRRDLEAFATSSGRFVTQLLSEEVESEALSRFSSSQEETGVHANAYAGSITSDYYWANYTTRPVTNTLMGPAARIRPRWKRISRVSCLASSAALASASKTRRLLSNFDVTTVQSFRDLLWEVIPYSFVIDWFVDMRGLWAPFNRWQIAQNLSSHLGYSTKMTCEYDVTFFVGKPYDLYYGAYPWGYRNPSSASSLVVGCSAPGRYVQYSRTAGFPPATDWSTSLDRSGLSYSQLASGFSLIAQRVF